MARVPTSPSGVIRWNDRAIAATMSAVTSRTPLCPQLMRGASTSALLFLVAVLGACSEFRPKSRPDAGASTDVLASDGDGAVTPSCTSDALCDDKNPCTTDLCDTMTGTCSHPATAVPAACDDSDVCTSDDRCTAGTCVGTARTCPSDDSGCLAGQCDAAKGGCVTAPAPDGTACTAKTLCTATAACKGGVCVEATAKTCPAPEDPCLVAACDPATGTCGSTAAPDGGACDDGSACTLGDQCTGGACKGKEKTCPLPAGTCRVATCDPKTGACGDTAAPPGAVCDDGDLCTQNDTCATGACAGVTADCSSLDGACAKGACAPDSGKCTTKARPDGTSCDDADACTQTDLCSGGTCSPGTIKDCSGLGDTCNVGECVPASGTCIATPKAATTACDDNSICTFADHCQGGVCLGTPKDCDFVAKNACHKGGCNVLTGDCISVPNPAADGKTCDDGLFCTVGDACAQGSGVCTGTLKDCAGTANTCQNALCDETNDTCTTTPKPDATPCDDGLKCSTNDTCKSGQCVAGGGLDCASQAGPCELAACDDATGGCKVTKAPDGTACQDASACTTGDQCADGKCVGGAVDCSSANAACATGECNVATGTCEAKVHTDGTACSDGVDCTVGDLCQAGVCTPGLKVGCPCPGPPRSVVLAQGCFTAGGGAFLTPNTGFTIEWWVKTTSKTPAILLDQRKTETTGEEDWHISYAAPSGLGQFRFHYGNTSNADTTLGMQNVALNDDKWHHVAVTRTSASQFSVQTWWVDGKPLATVTTVNSNSLSNTLPLAIGCSRLATGTGPIADGFAGQLDELRISRFARYTTQFTPPARLSPDEATVALWRFDEPNPQASGARDVSGQGRNAVVLPASAVGTITASLAVPTGFDGCCGEGSLDAGETCDDANVTGGDGCAATCDLEGQLLRRSFAANGVDSCIKVTGATFLESPAELTLELWLRLDKPASVVRLLDHRETAAVGEHDWSLSVDTAGKPAIHFGGSAGGDITSTFSKVVADGAWHHLALTRTAFNVVRWFLDGTADLPQVLTGVAPIGNTAPLWIGCGLGTGEFVAGTIDEVRFSSGARYKETFVPAKDLAPDGDTLFLLNFDVPVYFDAQTPDLGPGAHHGSVLGASPAPGSDVP